MLGTKKTLAPRLSDMQPTAPEGIGDSLSQSRTRWFGGVLSLILYGHQVWEGLDVSEVLFLCEQHRVDVVIITAEVEDGKMIENPSALEKCLLLTSPLIEPATGFSVSSAKTENKNR